MAGLPNIQKLGDFSFDSNKVQPKSDYLIAKDIKTGKDFAINRNENGTYNFATHTKYIAKKGDSISKIALENKVSIKDLIKDNEIENPNKLAINQELKLPLNLKQQTKAIVKKDFFTYLKEEDAKHNDEKIFKNFKEEDIDNEIAILNYRKERKDIEGNFIIVDKKTNQLKVYDNNSNLIKAYTVGLGKESQNDRYTINSKNKKIDRNVTSAGIYEIDEKGKHESYKHLYENNIMLLKSESGLRQAMSIHQVPSNSNERNLKLLDADKTNDNFSNGCINCTKADYEEFNKHFKPSNKVYVLPNEKGNYFKHENGTLRFTTNRDKNQGQYNFSPKQKDYKPYSIEKTGNSIKDTFNEALVKEKRNLMQDLGIDSATYDNLAKASFGILGQESGFGEGSFNPRNSYKAENLYSKFFDSPEVRNTRSLGLTQIRPKNIDPVIAEKYHLNAETMFNPYQSAIATVEQLNQKRRTALALKEKYPNMNPDNVIDYAIEGYNKPGAINKGLAIPENNTYVKSVKNKMKKNINNNKGKIVAAKFAQGGNISTGDVLGGVSQLAPLLNLAVPGLGTGVGAVAGLGAQYFNSQEAKKKEAEAAMNNPANYSNQNAFGYNSGGMLSGLAQGAGLVTGAPNQIDGNQMNYKGTPIALNHGETLDTNKDRVISKTYFNPLTGKKIVDEDKALKRARGKAETKLKEGPDVAAQNTIKFNQKQEDALFKMQESIAQMAGDRNRPQDIQQQRYQQGGPITPNIQKLGNISFDSNNTRWDNTGSHLIAKDMASGKDYGVIRKADGSYDWHQNGNVSDNENIQQVQNFFKTSITSPAYKERMGIQDIDNKQFVDYLFKSKTPKKELTKTYGSSDKSTILNSLNNEAQVGHKTLLDFANDFNNLPINWTNHGGSFSESQNGDAKRIQLDRNQIKGLGEPEDVMAHEMSHYKRKNKFIKNNPTLSSQLDYDISPVKESVYSDMFNLNNREDSHDDSLEEMAADLDALRYHLKKQGVVKDPYNNFYIDEKFKGSDSDGQKILDAINNHPRIKDQFTTKRIKRLVKPEKILELMNAVSQSKSGNSNDQVIYANKGGYLPVNYKQGGAIMNYVNGGQPEPAKGTPQWYAWAAQKDNTFQSQPIGVPKVNPIYKQYDVFSDAPKNKYAYNDPFVNMQTYWGNNFDVSKGKTAYNTMIQHQNEANKGVKGYAPIKPLNINNVYDKEAHQALFESEIGKGLFSNDSQFTNRLSPDKKSLYSFSPTGVKSSPVQYTTEASMIPKTLPDGTPFNPLAGLYGTASSIAGNMNQEQLNTIGSEGFFPEQRPVLSESEAKNLIGSSSDKENFWTKATMGEKVAMGSQAASLLAKGIESFQPLQKQAYRPNMAPISLTQLDPSAILNRNQQSYQSALYANQGNTANQNVGYQQSLFANKLAADNQALSQYQGQNADLRANYEQRLAQRQSENNANANQVDDIMARRRGAREGMRMGVYGDVAQLGMGVGNMMNNRLSTQAVMGMQKGIAPDVWNNYVKSLSPEMKKYLNIKG